LALEVQLNETLAAAPDGGLPALNESLTLAGDG
jgi:hypothetical protein